MIITSKGLPRLIFCAAATFFCLLCISSCTAPGRTGPENAYGRNNKLLYLFDKAYMLHVEKKYQESIAVFAQAKRTYEALYTKSLSRIIGSFLVNDYALPYGGEDFERVMVNIFQALNYALRNDLEGALVEARDVDSLLKLINSRYKPGQKNVYSDDAFARFLTGILYEASMSSQGYNDAYISYARAMEAYENNYAAQYNLRAPLILKENLFAAAQFMGEDELAGCRAKYGEAAFLSLKEKAKKAEVYLIQYSGLAPEKTEFIIPVVLPDSAFIPLAFPRYRTGDYAARDSQILAETKTGVITKVKTQLAEDISAIALESLKDREIRTIAKVIASAGVKFIAQRQAHQAIEKKHGGNAASGISLASNFFNFFANRADLRSWRTLPSQIRVARMLLDPGEYRFNLETFDSRGAKLENISLGDERLLAGEKKFLIVRSSG
jgi:uncharacterized protein